MKTKVLFVCMGNICRSPAAEGVMINMVKKAGLEDEIFCDSAGTGGWHVGEGADRRMKQHSQKRGYDLTSIGRQFNPKKDFDYFDWVITMDEENYRNIRALDPSGKYLEKTHRMVDFCASTSFSEVPDPYYDGEQGFETVLDIIEDGCSELLKKLS